jgi:hypothetical protein
VSEFESALALGADIKRVVERKFSFRWYAYGLGAMTAAGAYLGEFSTVPLIGNRSVSKVGKNLVRSCSSTDPAQPSREKRRGEFAMAVGLDRLA